GADRARRARGPHPDRRPRQRPGPHHREPGTDLPALCGARRASARRGAAPPPLRAHRAGRRRPAGALRSRAVRRALRRLARGRLGRGPADLGAQPRRPDRAGPPARRRARGPQPLPRRGRRGLRRPRRDARGPGVHRHVRPRAGDARRRRGGPRTGRAPQPRGDRPPARAGFLSSDRGGHPEPLPPSRLPPARPPPTQGQRRRALTLRRTPMTPPRTPRRRDLVRGPALAGLAGAGLSACAGGDGPRRTDSVRIILGHGAAPGNPRSEGALAFQRLVAEKSDGEVEVQILGQESVGSDSEMMVSVASGTLDMSINSQGPFSSYVPEASLIGLPFLFENAQHAYQVLDGEVQQSIAALSEEKGFHVLGFWDNGMRDITNSV